MAFLRKLPRRCAGVARFTGLLSEIINNNSRAFSTNLVLKAPNQENISTRQIDPLDLRFNDPSASFKSKTMVELIRAYVVYQLCSIDYLVENNMKVCFNL